MDKDTALNLALEALEKSARNWPSDSVIQAITAIKQARSAPVQEPVALVIDGVLVKSSLPEKYTGHLYTTPPAAQRQWVGLSEQELKAIWYDAETGGAMLLRFAEAIEAKLKAKNG